MIEIYNKCTLDASNTCNVISGAKTTISSPIKAYMTDNGDGTYTYSYSVQLDGAVSVVIRLINGNGVSCKWYGNQSFTEPPVLTNTTSVINYNFDGSLTPLFAGYGEHFTAILSGKIKAPTTNTHTFYFFNDDGSKILFDGEVKVNRLGNSGANTDAFSVSLIQNNYYDFVIYYFQIGGGIGLGLSWSSPTMSVQTIPSTAYFITVVVSSLPFQITVSCPIGYSGSNPSYPTVCKEIWGDGLKVGTEQWDDGNVIIGDGWSSVCNIKSGFAWSGGSIYAKDTWVYWTAGLYTNTDKSQCIPHCGDGFRAGSEKCDDGNTSSGDGCLNNCSSVEAGFVCSGGSPTFKDTCTKWDKGFYQNNSSNPTKWVPKWGDGFRVSYEHWDDGNLISGDGWSSDCMEIETGWVWFSENFGVADVWVLCDLGYDPNPDYSKCIGATVPRDVNVMAAASEIGAYTGVSSDLTLTVFSPSTSSSNSFGMVNQIQLAI